MINVSTGAGTANIREKVFSRAVRFIQDNIVERRVKRQLLDKALREPTPEFLAKLTELGIDPERLWWGPMTLFPWKAAAVVAAIEQAPPSSVVEVGAGTSTPILAALAHKYDFKFVSLENHPGTVKYIEAMVDDAPFAHRVNLQVCNFIKKQYPNGDNYYWYDTNFAADDRFDFALVDGPMSRLVGRNGALPSLMPHFTGDFRLYLDDAQRDHELGCVLEWQKHFPQLQADPVDGKQSFKVIHAGSAATHNATRGS